MTQASLEIVNERTNENTNDIKKLFKCIWGSNGTKSGVQYELGTMRGEMRELKTNLAWIKGLLILLTSSSIGVFVKVIFFNG